MTTRASIVERIARISAPLVAAGLKRFALLFGLWLVLTSGSSHSAGDAGSLVVGGLAAAAATLLSLRLQPAGRVVRLLHVVALAPGFLWQSFLGGLDVAWRALHPRLPVDPGWARYRVRLPAGAPRVALGDEVSLMPGTLAAGSHGDILYVHYLDRSQAVESRLAAEEKRIGRSMGATVEGPDD